MTRADKVFELCLCMSDHIFGHGCTVKSRFSSGKWHFVRDKENTTKSVVPVGSCTRDDRKDDQILAH